MAFALGNDTAAKSLLNSVDLLLGLGNNLGLFGGDAQVGHGDAQSGAGAPAETDVFNGVEQINGGGASQSLVTITDHATDAALSERIIVERHSFREDVVKDAAAYGGGYLAGTGFEAVLENELAVGRQLENNFSVDVDLSQLISSNGLVNGGKELSFAPVGRMGTSKEIDAQNDVLTGRNDGLSVGR